MKKKVYISGKITGLKDRAAERNFLQGEIEVIQKGWEPINPLRINQAEICKTWENCMINDLRELFKCDAIYMLSNWETSKGSRCERAIMFELGREIIYQS